MINTRLLKAKIYMAGYKMNDLARLLGISYPSLYCKVYGKTEFKPSELLTLSKLLEIENINELFLQ